MLVFYIKAFVTIPHVLASVFVFASEGHLDEKPEFIFLFLHIHVFEEVVHGRIQQHLGVELFNGGLDGFGPADPLEQACLLGSIVEQVDLFVEHFVPD